MPTAFNRGHQALPPSAPTPHVLPPPSGTKSHPDHEDLPTFYGLDYYHNRLKALGLTKDKALDYGLDVDAQGNILQLVRRFDGSFIEFIPQQFRKKVDRILNHRSHYQPHLEMYYRLLAVTRYHPDHLKANPQCPKYGNQFGEKVRPLPAPLAIKAYRENTTGGTIAFIEGYFKAIALDLAGVESVAFTGITVYRIDPALREYLLRRRPNRIFIMYDNDALEVTSASPERAQRAEPSPLSSGEGPGEREKRQPALTSRRNEDFANSARKFATALFSLFSTKDHTCEIIFVMGKPDLGADAGAKKGPSKGEQPKGLDDLIEAQGPEPVTKDLLNFNFTPTFRKSKFFAGFTLAKSTCHRKINRLFLGKNYRHWYERLTSKASRDVPPLLRS